MTANRGGRDDLPATGESLPSHSLSQSQAGRLRVAGQAEAKGRAADEAAARRKLRACPLADAKAAGFESAHGFQAAFGHVGNHPGRTPDLRVQDQPGGKRDFGQRAATGEEEVSASELPGRTGFRPGSCETGGPRTSVHGRQAEPEASAEDPAINGPELRPRDRDGGKRDVSSEPPNGEPPGLRPWSGSPRGNRLRLRPEKDPGGSGARTPGSGAATRNRPERDASPPRLGFSKGTVGAGGNVGPHYCSGPSRASVDCVSRSHFRGQSSRCRPASWHRA